VNRPIKWTAERSESFISDAHGRDHVSQAELALDKDGKFLALRVKTIANMGAYLSTFASCIPTYLYATLLAGQYTTPAIYCEVKAVVHQHRAGRRLSRRRPPRGDLRGRAHRRAGGGEMKLDPAEIRRRNFIRRLPVPDPGGAEYDTGDYPPRSTARSSRRLAGFPARKAGRGQARGKLRGIGYASYIEACGLAPSNIAGQLGARAGLFEAGEVRVHPTGSVTVSDHRLAQPRPGPRDDLRAGRVREARHADRAHRGRPRRHLDPVLFGMGTYGSRSLAVGGSAIVKALDKMIAKGKKIAAHMMEAAEADIEFDRRRVQGGRHRQGEDLRRGGASPPTCRTTIRSTSSSRAWTRTRSTTRRTSPSRPARTSARSRSIRRPASSRWRSSPRSTTSATSSIR
jgi:carbon-monoxide dehydrogenase large subunit